MNGKRKRGGMRAKKGNKESGENKGLWKEADNEERHLNPYPLELVNADFLRYAYRRKTMNKCHGWSWQLLTKVILTSD